MLRSPDGERSVPFGEFFRQPGNTPEREHALRPGELITAVEIPAGPHTARVRLPEGPRPAVLRVRAHLGRGRPAHPWRRDPGGEGRRRRRRHRAVEAARRRAGSGRQAPSARCGPTPRHARRTGPAWRTTDSRSSCSGAPSNASSRSWEEVSSDGDRAGSVACGRQAEGDRPGHVRRRTRDSRPGTRGPGDAAASPAAG